MPLFVIPASSALLVLAIVGLFAGRREKRKRLAREQTGGQMTISDKDENAKESHTNSGIC